MELRVQQPQTKPQDLRTFVTDVPDFPKPGILFRDISPLLRDHFQEVLQQLDQLLSPAEWEQVDVIAGVEARGFVLAAGLAAVKQKGFVKIRKAGKLPGKVVQKKYGLEYGEDALEMQPGTGRMLIVDDVLATGGTLKAAADLAQETGHDVRGFLCLIDLKFLNQFSWNEQVPRSVMEYEA